MWLIDLINSRFSILIAQEQYLTFIKLYAISCLIKFTVETHRGYFSFFNEGNYLREFYIATSNRAFISVIFYKAVYLTKIFGAIGLLIGINKYYAIPFILISLLLEIRLYFKFHTNFYFFIGLFLLLPNGNGLGQSTIAVLCMIMYIATAIKKINPIFLNGSVVKETMMELYNDRSYRKYIDVPFFDFLYKKAISPLLNKKTLLKVSMYLVVVIEILIPILLFSGNISFAFLLGFLLHSSFCFISLTTLFHFGFLTLSTYILFYSPI